MKEGHPCHMRIPGVSRPVGSGVDFQAHVPNICYVLKISLSRDPLSNACCSSHKATIVCIPSLISHKPLMSFIGFPSRCALSHQWNWQMLNTILIAWLQTCGHASLHKKQKKTPIRQSCIITKKRWSGKKGAIEVPIQEPQRQHWSVPCFNGELVHQACSNLNKTLSAIEELLLQLINANSVQASMTWNFFIQADVRKLYTQGTLYQNWLLHAVMQSGKKSLGHKTLVQDRQDMKLVLS